MQHIITPDPINLYAEQFTSPESEVLADLNKETHAHVKGAQMISGHLQGMVLQLISQMLQPRLILELGTYTGYSAISLSTGLKPDGKLHTIDVDASLQSMRNSYWQKAGVDHKIVQHIGQAQDLIPTIKDGAFDLVFIDADKKGYCAYFDLVLENMNPGGIILADNVLFHGEIILPEDQQSKNAKYINQFNRKVADDKRVAQVLLPIRDGLMVIRKL